MPTSVLPTLTFIGLGVVMLGLPALTLLDTAGLDPARLLMLAAVAAPMAAFIAWSLRQPVSRQPVTIAAREREARR